MIYSFGPFILDLERGSLLGPDGERKLRLQAFRLLEVLVERAPKVLSHDQLLDLVWGKEHLSASSLKQAVSEVRQALGDDPARPIFIETVHRRGYRFIAPVSIGGVLEETEIVEPEVIRSPAVRRDGRGLLFVSGVAVVVAVGVALYSWLAGSGQGSAAGRHSIAVVGFTLVAAEPDQVWASAYLSRTLVNEIMADASLRIVSEDRVADMRRDLGFEPRRRFESEEILEIGRNLGADFIAGGVLKPGRPTEPAEMELVVMDTLSGRSAVVIRRTAPPGDFFALTSGLGVELRSALRPRVPVWGELPRSTPLPISDDAEVQRLYATGVERLRLFDTLAAIDQFEKAAALDPTAPLVRWQLAQALLHSGNQLAAAAAADDAAARLEGLPREQQLAIEAFVEETHHRWDEAIMKYMALQEFIPDAVNYRLRLAMAMIRAGRAEEALEVFATLHQMAPELNGDPRISVNEAKALAQVSRFEDAETAASAAVRTATEIGASIVKAAALRERAWARQKMGRTEEALEDLGNSRRLFATYGHLSGQAGVLSGLGAMHLEAGRLSEADEVFSEAKEIFHEIGERRSEATVAYNLAVIRANRGDLAGARADFFDALEIKKELNDTALANVYDALTQIDRMLGDVEGARAWLREARRAAAQSGDRLMEARTVRAEGDFERDVGRFAAALELYVEALRLLREIGDPLEEGRTLLVLSAVKSQEGDLEAALEDLEGAETLFRSSGFLADLVAALERMGAIHRDLEEFDRAEAMLKEALNLALDLEDEAAAERIRSVLETLPGA